MSATTGPVLALGAVTVVNRTVFQDQPMDWRIPIATGLLALGAGAVEKAFPDGAQVLAWTALLTACLTRLDPKVPAPVESAVAWWTRSKGGTTETMPQRGGAGGGDGKRMEV